MQNPILSSPPCSHLGTIVVFNYINMCQNHLLCAEQVAYGLIELWEKMLDSQADKQERIGLARLLEKYGLPVHRSKQGAPDVAI